MSAITSTGSLHGGMTLARLSSGEGKHGAVSLIINFAVMGKEGWIMASLIDRQAAIDFIDAGHLCNPNEPRWSDNDVVNFLKSRPSAQPVITCDGCRFVGTYETDFPCRSCVRREKDYYEPERRPN